ncbi:MAG: hypothetical protein WAS73_17460 [Defluviicoccus sp.]
MSDDEKRDFRATRQELTFELEDASAYTYPSDFNLIIIHDFCDAFRQRENRSTWTNEDVLIDRNLLRRNGTRLVAHNALVLMAAKNPRKTIPGCRIRIQRFGDVAEGSGSNYQPLVDRTADGNIVDLISQADQISCLSG